MGDSSPHATCLCFFAFSISPGHSQTNRRETGTREGYVSPAYGSASRMERYCPSDNPCAGRYPSTQSKVEAVDWSASRDSEGKKEHAGHGGLRTVCAGLGNRCFYRGNFFYYSRRAARVGDCLWRTVGHSFWDHCHHQSQQSKENGQQALGRPVFGNLWNGRRYCYFSLGLDSGWVVHIGHP